MKYIKIFESFDDVLDKVDDISAYIPTKTSSVQISWRPISGKLKSINNDEYLKLKDIDRNKYAKSYAISFLGLSNFFDVSNDILNRSKSYNLKFFLIHRGHRVDNYCVLFFMKIEDFEKMDIDEVVKYIQSKEFDILLEEDVKINSDEVDVILDNDNVIVVKPKTYKSAIKYSSNTSWKFALKKNQKWIDKYMTPGSYYGGMNWYKSTKVTQEVKNWYQKLLKLPPKIAEKEIKEFFTDFPRYILYIVTFKKLSVDEKMSKVFLLHDISRDEYGELPHNFTSSYAMNGYYSDMLDACHNQIKVENAAGERITFKDIHDFHRTLFSQAFRSIEEDANIEKDKMYDLLGFWSDKGGEYSKNPLIFIRGEKNPGKLLVTRKDLIKKNDNGGLSFSVLGHYNDKDFDYWELDKEVPVEKEAPKTSWKDYFNSIRFNVEKLKGSLDKYNL